MIGVNIGQQSFELRHPGGTATTYARYNILASGTKDVPSYERRQKRKLRSFPSLMTPCCIILFSVRFWGLDRTSWQKLTICNDKYFLLNLISYQEVNDRLSSTGFSKRQTWNLSKILHRRIFILKILQRQFHLISTVLVRKNTKNE